MDDKVATDFMTICERTGVWAALSERSFEVGERSEVGDLEGTILPLYVRTKSAYNTQENEQYVPKDRFVCLIQYLCNTLAIPLPLRYHYGGITKG